MQIWADFRVIANLSYTKQRKENGFSEAKAVSIRSRTNTSTALEMS